MSLKIDVMSPESIVQQIQVIQDVLERATQEDNIVEVAERSSELATYLAISGKMLADAKYWQDEELTSIMEELIPQKLSPSVLKDFAKSKNKVYNHMVTICDRINKTCTHQLDWCRTIISKLKEEMKYLHYNKT